VVSNEEPHQGNKEKRKRTRDDDVEMILEIRVNGLRVVYRLSGDVDCTVVGMGLNERVIRQNEVTRKKRPMGVGSGAQEESAECENTATLSASMNHRHFRAADWTRALGRRQSDTSARSDHVANSLV
jgi:hypothetical protein